MIQRLATNPAIEVDTTGLEINTLGEARGDAGTGLAAPPERERHGTRSPARHWHWAGRSARTVLRLPESAGAAECDHARGSAGRRAACLCGCRRATVAERREGPGCGAL